jgi:hypothetical protein
VNVAVVLADPTVTVAGTVTAAVLRDRFTVAPPVFDTVTVHVAVAPDARVAGTHARLLRVAGVVSVIVAVCILAFSVAVKVAN